MKLASLLKQKKPVIFADEASWSTWRKHSIVRTWVDEKKPFPYKMNTQALENVTIYGAVSNILPKLVFMTGKGTTQSGWKTFLIELKR